MDGGCWSFFLFIIHYFCVLLCMIRRVFFLLSIIMVRGAVETYYSRFRNATRRASTSHSAPRSLANPTGKSHSELSAGEWDFQIAARKRVGARGARLAHPTGTLAFGEAPSPVPTRRREAPSACSHWEAAPLTCARHFLWGTFLKEIFLISDLTFGHKKSDLNGVARINICFNRTVLVAYRQNIYIYITWCVPSPVTPPSPRELRLRLLFDTETGTDPHQGRHPLRERNPDITREGRLPFRVQSLFELTNSKPTKLALHSHRRWRWTLRLPARGARSSGGIPKSSVRAEKRRIG